MQELDGNVNLYIINNGLLSFFFFLFFFSMQWQPCKAIQFGHDCFMRIYLSKIYRILYTNVQLVYIYWLYKVMYVYKVQKQKHLQ